MHSHAHTHIHTHTHIHKTKYKIFFSCDRHCHYHYHSDLIVHVQVLEEGRASFQNMNPAEESSSAASNVLFWWQLFTGTLLFSFALSCVSQFAQFYQMTIDQEASDKLREHLPPSVRTSLLSPG
jgi:hypothetical protein